MKSILITLLLLFTTSGSSFDTDDSYIYKPYDVDGLYSNYKTRKNYMYIFGGGGEPTSRDTTIFDYNLIALEKFTSKYGYKVFLSFNKDHAKTVALAKKMGTHTTFSQENFEKLIDDLEHKIISGKIKPGDKLILMFLSHGGKSEEGEKTHGIALPEQLSARYGGDSVSLDKIQTVVDLAKEKYIKLFIFDSSCYSGATLKLDNGQACIVTSTGDKNYAIFAKGFNKKTRKFYTHDFASLFIQRMEQGNSVKDIFLNARESDTEIEFPQISGEMGQYLNKEFYQKIYFLLFKSEVNYYLGKVVPGELEEFMDKFESFDAIEDKVEIFMTDLVAIHSLALKTESFTESGRIGALMTSIQLSMSFYKRYFKIYKKKAAIEKYLKSSLSKHDLVPLKNFRLYALFSDFDNEIKYLNDGNLFKVDPALNDKLSNHIKPFTREIINRLKEKMTPEMIQTLKEYEKILLESGRTVFLAQNIATETRRVYQLWYEEEDENESACDDFIF